MSAEDNKAIMRRFVMDCQSGGDLSMIDELVSPEFVNHAEVPGLPSGREGIRALFGAFHQAFIHAQFANGDRAATHKTFHGLHVADFMGVPASGNEVHFDVIDILRLEDGKLVEHWNVVDMPTLLRQISG
jgi:predicted ester cyclase